MVPRSGWIGLRTPDPSAAPLLVALLLVPGCGPQGSPEDDPAVSSLGVGTGSPEAHSPTAVADSGRLLLVSEAGPLAWSERPEVVFRAVGRFFDGDWPHEAESP